MMLTFVIRSRLVPLKYHEHQLPIFTHPMVQFQVLYTDVQLVLSIMALRIVLTVMAVIPASSWVMHVR